MTYPIAKLGDVAEFIRGITFKPDDVVSLDADDAVVCMRTKNVQALLDCDDLLAVPSQFVRRKDQYLEEGDILVSSANSWNLVGKCCWIPSLPWRAAFGGFISVLRGDSARVDRRYLYWWFASDRIQALLRSFGQKTTNISNLNIERCLQLDLPLPPLPEQRRIAAILDKADTLRSKRREALAQLDHLAQSIFVEMFGDPVTNPKGWPSASFDSLCSRVTVGIVVQPASYYRDFGVPALRSLNVKPGKIVLNDLVYFSEQDNTTKLRKTQLRAGDLVLVRSGQPGTTAIVPQELDGINAIDILIASPETDKANPTYLCEFFNSNAGRSLVLSSQRGQIQKHLNVGSLNAAPIMLPTLSLQRQFDDRISAVKALSVQSNLALDELNCLFATLQHRAFRGEL